MQPCQKACTIFSESGRLGGCGRKSGIAFLYPSIVLLLCSGSPQTLPVLFLSQVWGEKKDLLHASANPCSSLTLPSFAPSPSSPTVALLSPAGMRGTLAVLVACLIWQSSENVFEWSTLLAAILQQWNSLPLTKIFLQYSSILAEVCTSVNPWLLNSMSRSLVRASSPSSGSSDFGDTSPAWVSVQITAGGLTFRGGELFIILPHKLLYKPLFNSVVHKYYY